MRIVIPGGSGQLGTLLARTFIGDGHEVVVVSRNPKPGLTPWRVVHWDGKTVGLWAAELEGAAVVINLAGRSVNCRYTAANRAAIRDSRVDSARAVGMAIGKCRTPPPLWLQASTATIYTHRFDSANDERSGVIGGQEPNVPSSWAFSVEVAKAWEEAAQSSAPAGTRLVLMRTSLVMSRDRGGIFATLLRLVRVGLGGAVGDGRQYVSWIHERDFARAMYWLIKHDAMVGVVNVTAPTPIPNAEFMREIRQAAGTPIGLPATRWMVDIGSLLMLTEPELVLKSRRVAPLRLLESGFDFEYPQWQRAAVELVGRPASAPAT